MSLNNPLYTISDIRSTLAYMMEDGYNDRFTFKDNGSVLEVYDEHLFKRVLTCEYVDGHYIMSPFPDTDTDDRLVLKCGPDDQSPWVQLNKWLDAYDTEYKVNDKQYITYLEKKVEKLEQQLNDEHCKLVVSEIELDTLNLDDIELTSEEIDTYIPYRNEIQDILENEGLAENRTNASGEEQLVQVSNAEEIFIAGCEYVLKMIKKNGDKYVKHS